MRIFFETALSQLIEDIWMRLENSAKCSRRFRHVTHQKTTFSLGQITARQRTFENVEIIWNGK